MNIELDEIINRLYELGSEEKKNFKAKKYRIYNENSLGIYQKDLSLLAKDIGKNTDLGIALFNTEIYDARLLCAKICNPKEITEELMEYWVTCFDTWEICDSFCMQLFKYHDNALEKVMNWTKRENEFEKRAGFVIMATYGFANKNATNEIFESFFPIIIAHAGDERNFVKKAVNWALRQTGKRNIDLQKNAIKIAKELIELNSKSAQWIGKDALRELQSPNVSILDYPRNIYRK